MHYTQHQLTPLMALRMILNFSQTDQWHISWKPKFLQSLPGVTKFLDSLNLLNHDSASSALSVLNTNRPCEVVKWIILYPSSVVRISTFVCGSIGVIFLNSNVPFDGFVQSIMPKKGNFFRTGKKYAKYGGLVVTVEQKDVKFRQAALHHQFQHASFAQKPNIFLQNEHVLFRLSLRKNIDQITSSQQSKRIFVAIVSYYHWRHALLFF